MEQDRCPNCHAMVAADAAWCGLCLTRLKPLADPYPGVWPEPEPGVAPDTEPDAFTETPLLSVTPGVDADDEAGRAAREPLPPWECPMCGLENPFDGQVCSACGTPFGRLFEEPKAVSGIAPKDAAFAGLVPGMGHYKMGLHADGVVRMFVFAASLVVLVMFASSSPEGAAVLITALFALMTGLCVAESAYDSFRLASRERELVSAVRILWVFLGVFGLAVLAVFVISRPASP